MTPKLIIKAGILYALAEGHGTVQSGGHSGITGPNLKKRQTFWRAKERQVKEKNMKRLTFFAAFLTAFAVLFCAGASVMAEEAAPDLPGLQFESRMDFDYAEEVEIYTYQDGYKLIVAEGEERYLLVPEGKDVPEELPEDITILRAPIDHIYLAATASMALFDSLDALDCVRLSSLQADGWYIENAAKAMEDGKILFSGKYSEPDYELMIQEGCDLAVESTMIYHSPKVQEMIENMGIPVFIDHASSESHPLGRTEWIRVYGALLDREEEANAFMEKQKEILTSLEGFPNTEKKVAYFYLSSDGSVVLRSSTDYVPKMIEIAGARYIPEDLYSESNRSTVSVTMEEFYTSCIDADYLVYNATIDLPVKTMEDLFDKSELFHDFKAVKEGKVWCTGKYLYQATDIVGNLILDFHNMITDADPDAMTFLSKIE